MPLYTFRNKETGEVFEETLTSDECERIMKEDNNFERVFKAPSFVYDSVDPLRRAGGEWNNLLTNIKKGSGEENTINV